MGMRGEVAIMRLMPKLVRLSYTSMLTGEVTFTLHDLKARISKVA